MVYVLMMSFRAILALNGIHALWMTMDDIFYGPTFDDIVGVIEKREQGRPSELLAKQKAEQMVFKVKVKMMMMIIMNIDYHIHKVHK